MAIKSVFKSRIESCQYVFQNGKSAVFSEGRFLTDVPQEIAELMGEVGEEGNTKSRHPFIWIDPDEKQLDTTVQDAIKDAQSQVAAAIVKAAEQGTALTPDAVAKIAQATVRDNTAVVGVASSAQAALAALASNSK